MQTIIFGITGGIAAFKVLDLIKKLRKQFNIEVIMTKHAAEMISPKEFEKIGIKVNIHMFEKGFDYRRILEKREVEHISLSDKADLIVIAPATADVIGKIANGIADDLLTTTVMATLAKTIICPSMNVKMWQNPLFQANLLKLKHLGYWIIDPDYGDLACGYEGMGRLASLETIEKEILKFFNNFGKLKNKRIVVTAGGTSEYIDPVRVITNESSGKMGIYIAEEFAKYGADVTLIRANTKIEPNFKVNDIKVKTSKEMFDAIKKQINTDIIVHTAAVSDFTLKKSNKKIDSKQNLNLELEKTTKVLDNIKKFNKNVFLVGFKAEYKVSEKDLIEKAYRKLQQSNADLIIANDVGIAGRGFDVDTNEVFIVDKKKKVKHIELDSKRIIAENIIEDIILRIR